MTQGGFLTRKLFVPRTIWYQSLVRLPAAESKTSACQTLHSMLNKMSLQAQRGHLTLMVEPGGGVDGDQNRTMILRELEALEAATVQIQNKLSKKLSFIHRPGKRPGHPPASTGFSAIPGSGALSISTQHHHSGHSPYQDENPMSPDGHDDNESSTTTTPVTSPIRKSVVGAGIAGGGAGGVDTASLKNQWKSFSKSVQKSIGNDKMYADGSFFLAFLLIIHDANPFFFFFFGFPVGTAQRTQIRWSACSSRATFWKTCSSTTIPCRPSRPISRS